MIKLYSSKSYCEPSISFSTRQAAPERHCSTTQLVTIHNKPPLTISNASSNESFTSSPITQDDLYSIILAEQTSEKAKNIVIEPAEINCIKVSSKKHDLSDIMNKYAMVTARKCQKCTTKTHRIEEYIFTNKHTQSKCKFCIKKYKRISKEKHKELSQDLIKFVIRKDSNEYNKLFMANTPVVECVASTFVIDPFQMFECEDFTTSTVDDYDLVRSSATDILAYPDTIRKYLLNMNVCDWEQGPKQIRFGCFRHKKSTKNIKFKKLLHSNNILSICKNINYNLNTKLKLDKNSLSKATSHVHIKYHVYAQIEPILRGCYIQKMDRAICVYSAKNSTRTLTNEIIFDNKIFHRQLKLADSKTNKKDEEGDIQVVVNNSIEHGRLNNELTKTYDQIYLEFLISIQHREITPEDYEYLSRLDELIKKKTVSENILKSLKWDTVCENTVGQDVCGICLDAYEIGQIRKHLPCGHKFHGDCIDQWLSNQSTDCPLDKTPVDQASISLMELTEENVDNNESNVSNEIENCLHEMIDRVEIELKVGQCLSELMDRIELS